MNKSGENSNQIHLCCLCGRPITKEKAVRLGMGPDCYAKILKSEAIGELETKFICEDFSDEELYELYLENFAKMNPTEFTKMKEKTQSDAFVNKIRNSYLKIKGVFALRKKLQSLLLNEKATQGIREDAWMAYYGMLEGKLRNTDLEAHEKDFIMREIDYLKIKAKESFIAYSSDDDK